MSKFCGTCGSPLDGAAKFCGECGAANSPIEQAPASLSQASSTSAASTQPSPAQPSNVLAPPSAHSTALFKVGIAAVVILFVGGIAAFGAVYYVVHKVREKVRAATHQAEGDNSNAPFGELASMVQKAASTVARNDDDSGGFKGDPCRFLSKEDVSRAVGIEIVRTQAQDTGCSYIAKGDPADMVSKHMTSMVKSQAKSNGSNVTDDETKAIQQITGAFFKQQESSDKRFAKELATGEVLILSVSFSSRNAELEMKMNRMAFNRISGGNAQGKTTDQVATGDLDGIGDDAYEMGGTGLIFRKGKTVVHMMFPECPCDAKAIKPLAANIASQL
jgi:hypothetical protein